MNDATGSCQQFESLLNRLIAGAGAPSRSEREFLAAHGGVCKVCSLEGNVIGDLMGAGDSGLSGITCDADLAFKIRQLLVLDRKRRAAVRPLSSKRTVVAICTAAAAVLALGVYFVASFTMNPPVAEPAVGPAVLARFVAVTGEALVAGQAAVLNQTIGSGAAVQTREGSAALGFSGGARAMVHPWSGLVLARLTAQAIRFSLDRGEVTFTVPKLQSGSRFEVDTPAGSVSVVGTVFSVACRDGDCRIAVAKGRVKFERRGEPLLELGAGQLYSATAGLTVLPEAQREAMLRPEDDETTLGDSRGAADLSAHVAQAPVPVSPAALRSTGEKRTRRPRVPREARPPTETAEPVGQPSIEALIGEVHTFRRSRNWAAAVDTYQRLIALYPRSPEALTCLVPLGKIQLERLGQTERALTTFKRYQRIGKNGSLAQEAAWGVVMCLRKLNRKAEERDAARAFLEAYPASLYAPWIRERLEHLDAADRN